MKITAAMLRDIADMPPEAIPGVLRMLANQTDVDESRRAKDAARKRKSRGSHAEVHLTSADNTVTSADPSPKERSPLHPPKEITPTAPSEAKASSGVPRRRATRIPDDFHPDLAEAEAMGLRLVDARMEAESFVDYWRAKPTDATKLDWPATWRNWCRRAAKDAQRTTGPPRGGRSQNGFAAVAIEKIRNLGNDEHYHDFFAPPPAADAGTAPQGGRPDERHDGGGRKAEAASRQDSWDRGEAEDGGKIIDLEVVSRAARSSGG